MKRRLTRQEEFEILKLVLDKFLWLGVLIMAFGFWWLVSNTEVWTGFAILLGGALLLVLFAYFLIREYDYTKG